jgi:hypothetical protein
LLKVTIIAFAKFFTNLIRGSIWFVEDHIQLI